MMILQWDNSDKDRLVINGPWPFTIRGVDVKGLEDAERNHFFVGKIEW